MIKNMFLAKTNFDSAMIRQKMTKMSVSQPKLVIFMPKKRMLNHRIATFG